MNLFTVSISSMIMNAIQIFSYYKIPNKKVNLKSLELYLIYFLQTFLIILNYMYTENILKVACTFIIMLLTCKLLFRSEKLIKCFVIAFISEFLIIIAEFCFMIIMAIIIKVNNNLLIEIVQGAIFTNFAICLLVALILFTKIPTKIYYNIINLVKNISNKKIIIFLSFVIFCASILFYISYYNTNKFLTLFVNFIVTTIYFFVVIMILIKEHKYNIVNNKYLMTLKELEDYESIINEYRVLNHENKNQLYSIKGMTSSKKIKEYIDEIVDNKITDNEILLKQALLIPTGGLRGLIYSKLLTMKKNKIKYSLNIDKMITNKLMQSIPTKTMLDVCQIIGVFLDNAIEAVSNLEDKNVVIDIYNDENINISITNNIDKYVDINKIDKVGYTTKDGNHGYGLALVNKILKENKNLINIKTITRNSFKQELSIKK